MENNKEPVRANPPRCHSTTKENGEIGTLKTRFWKIWKKEANNIFLCKGRIMIGYFNSSCLKSKNFRSEYKYLLFTILSINVSSLLLFIFVLNVNYYIFNIDFKGAVFIERTTYRNRVHITCFNRLFPFENAGYGAWNRHEICKILSMKYSKVFSLLSWNNLLNYQTSREEL